MLNKLLFTFLAMLAGIGMQHLAVASGILNVSIPYSAVPPDDYSLAPKRR